MVARRHHPFSLVGARALGRHLGRVLEMAESSTDKLEYETKIARRFGLEQQLELPIPMPPTGMKEAATLGGPFSRYQSLLPRW